MADSPFIAYFNRFSYSHRNISHKYIRKFLKNSQSSTLHWFQFRYIIEGTNSNRGRKVRSTFYVEYDFGVSFIIKSRDIGFFQCEVFTVKYFKIVLVDEFIQTLFNQSECK